MGGYYPDSQQGEGGSEFNFDCGKVSLTCGQLLYSPPLQNYMGPPLECNGSARAAIMALPRSVMVTYLGFKVPPPSFPTFLPASSCPIPPDPTLLLIHPWSFLAGSTSMFLVPAFKLVLSAHFTTFYHLSPPFNAFYHLILPLITFLSLSTTFYHPLPLFITLYYL